MALEECYECGKEISSEAKSCPHCGAAKKKRKTSRFLSVIAVSLLGVIAYFVFEPELNPNIPTCESFRAERIFKKIFEDSPFAQQNRLRVLEVTERNEIESGPKPEDRVCEVTYRLTNTERRTYLYSFERKDSGGYFVRQRPK